MDHVIVVDLGYGDAGKGSVVDWLCASGPYRTVLRFNGGAQAAHLSRYMIVDPLALVSEEEHLCTVGVRDASM